MLQKSTDPAVAETAATCENVQNNGGGAASSSSAQPVRTTAFGRPLSGGLVIVGLFLLSAVAIYYRPLIQGEALYFRDLQIFFAPMKDFLGAAFRDGYWPWWNPAIQMGTPFFADPQSGVFYPLSLIFAIFDTPRGLSVSLIIHLLIGQLGAYRLARHGGFGRVPAAASALVYGLGGWSLSCSNMLTLAHSVAWAPWSILVCERLWRSANLRNIALAALVLAMQMYSGWPEMFILLAIALLVRRLFTPGILDWRWLPACLAAGVLAGGLFMPQFLATLEAFRASVRVGGLSTGELLEFSASTEQWLSLLRPPALSADNWDILTAFPDGHVPIFLSLHIGWLALFFVALALLKPSRYCAAWLIVAGIGVFLALGQANPLAVPLLKLLNPFRTPEKYLFLFHLGAAMLVAPGVERFLRWLPNKRLLHLVPGLLVLVVAGELIHAGSKIDLRAPAGYYDVSSSPEATLIRRDPGRVYTRSLAQENIDSVRELYAAFRNTLSPNIGAMAGLSHVGGVTFLPYRDNAQVFAMIDTMPPGERLARYLAFFGVRYVITDDPSFVDRPGWLAQAKQLTPLLWQLNQTTPLLSFARLVVPGRDQDLVFAAADSRFANGEMAYVPPAHAVAGAKSLGRVLAVNSRAGWYQVEVESSGIGWLVLRENYYPGWTAKIDGRPAEIIRTNKVFMGVSVPPGKHQVTFEFRPTQLDFGLRIALLSIVLLILLALAGNLKIVNRWIGK